eukprot:4742945-Pleurochrysis_carterae.AAC.2
MTSAVVSTSDEALLSHREVAGKLGARTLRRKASSSLGRATSIWPLRNAIALITGPTSTGCN